MGRPYGVPPVIFVGKVDGEWPLQAFTNDDHARDWASKEPGRRRYFALAVPDDVVVYTAEVVPATTRAKQVDP